MLSTELRTGAPLAHFAILREVRRAVEIHRHPRRYSESQRDMATRVVLSNSDLLGPKPLSPAFVAGLAAVAGMEG